jgi:hypothetical protein
MTDTEWETDQNLMVITIMTLTPARACALSPESGFDISDSLPFTTSGAMDFNGTGAARNSARPGGGK